MVQHMFPVPKKVADEARWGLWARAYWHRGGTPVGVNTARMLAFPVKGDGMGGLIPLRKLSLRKIRHVARYFPRHEVDMKAKGWFKGQPGYPSAGRIAWALWGGHAGWDWAEKILAKHGKRG